MNRRHFVQTVAVAVALPSASWSAQQSRVSLGFSLYGMKSLPLHEALNICAAIGYSHVEFAINPGYVTEPSRFLAGDRAAAARLMRTLKLNLSCLMMNLSLTADDRPGYDPEAAATKSHATLSKALLRSE